MDDQRAVPDIAGAQQQPDAGEIVVERLVFVPPRLLIEQRRGIIALADAAQAVALQMLADQVDPAHHLPLGDPFQFLEADVPAAQGERFADHGILPGLGGDGGHLHGRRGRPDAAPQPVHAGDVHVGVAGHTRAVAGQLALHRFLQHHVTGQLRAVGPAPVIDLVHIRIGEQVAHRLPKAETHMGAVRRVKKQTVQLRQQLLAVAGAVFVRQDQRPRDAVARHLRLVGEQAAHRGKLLMPQLALVPFMHGVQKLGDHCFIHRVDIKRIDVIVEVQGLLPVRQVCDRAGGLPRRVDDLVTQIFLLVLLAHAVDGACAKAAGPAVLVIAPRGHPALFAFVDAAADVVHPLLAHIRRLQAAAGVHEIAAKPGLVHHGDLLCRRFDVQLLVP